MRFHHRLTSGTKVHLPERRFSAEIDCNRNHVFIVTPWARFVVPFRKNHNTELPFDISPFLYVQNLIKNYFVFFHRFHFHWLLLFQFSPLAFSSRLESSPFFYDFSLSTEHKWNNVQYGVLEINEKRHKIINFHFFPPQFGCANNYTFSTQFSGRRALLTNIWMKKMNSNSVSFMVGFHFDFSTYSQLSMFRQLSTWRCHKSTVCAIQLFLLV